MDAVGAMTFGSGPESKSASKIDKCAARKNFIFQGIDCCQNACLPQHIHRKVIHSAMPDRPQILGKAATASEKVLEAAMRFLESV